MPTLNIDDLFGNLGYDFQGDPLEFTYDPDAEDYGLGLTVPSEEGVGDLSWIDILTSGDYDPTAFYAGLEDIGIDAEGMQLVDWSNPVTGQYSYNDILMSEMSGDEIATMLAESAFADLEGQTTAGGDDAYALAVSNFTDEYGQYYNNLTWESDIQGMSGATAMQALMEQYQMDEGQIWNIMSAWESGELGTLDVRIDQLEEQHTAGVESIEESLQERVGGLRSQRKQQQRSFVDQAKALSSQQGRTGLAGGQTSLDKLKNLAANKIQQYSLGERELRSGAETAIEQLGETLGVQAEGAATGFFSGQATQLQGAFGALDLMMEQFLTESQGIYEDWLADIIEYTTGLTSQTGGLYIETGIDDDEETPEDESLIWFNPFGYEGDTNPEGTDYDNVVHGCMVPYATNYNPLATNDDGSCDFPTGDQLYGCTDPSAQNYNAEATVDDNSCVFSNDPTVFYGCTDPSATNYDSSATTDNGSCEFDDGTTYGCTDDAALNYDPNATYDNGTCTYSHEYDDTYGCLDSNATNYNPDALYDNGTCVYDYDSPVYGCADTSAVNYDPEAIYDDGSCIYEGSAEYGCTHSDATNYNPEATYDDGSCTFEEGSGIVYGCMEPGATNYNPEATYEDGSCEYPNTSEYGCTDPNASNYNDDASYDDGSCEYDNNASYGCMDPSATNYDETAIYGNNSCIYDEVILGCTDSSANNYNPDATQADGSCSYDDAVECPEGQYADPVTGNCTPIESEDVSGCTDPTADNYDTDATIDNNSCTYGGGTGGGVDHGGAGGQTGGSWGEGGCPPGKFPDPVTGECLGGQY